MNPHRGCPPSVLVVKFDGGALPLLCPYCRVIVGYMPSGWSPTANLRPERVVKAEALREAAARYWQNHPNHDWRQRFATWLLTEADRIEATR